MKTALLSVGLLLALICGSDCDWRDLALEVVAENTLHNVVVVSNPNPYQVIVSINGKTDSRIDTTQPIPRKLAPHECVKTVGGSLALAGH